VQERERLAGFVVGVTQIQEQLKRLTARG